MRASILAVALLVLSAPPAGKAGGAIDIGASALAREVGGDPVAVTAEEDVAARIADETPLPRRKPSPPRALQTAAELAKLSCAKDDVECQRFIGESPYRPHPRKGAKYRRFAGNVSFLLTDYELDRERRCLALAAYAEARGEGDVGMLAVMWVILNRIAQSETDALPCSIVVAPGVFEAIAAEAYAPQRAQIAEGLIPSHPVKLAVSRTDDSATIVDSRVYRRALLIAYHLLDGHLQTDPTEAATYFWSPVAQAALDRAPPSWRKRFVKTTSIGSHEFYRPRQDAAVVALD